MRSISDFPSQAVVQAYLFPMIDESKETFTWSKPNVALLYDYTRQKFGWIRSKFDDITAPVLRKMEERRSQKLLNLYFKTKTSSKSIEPSLSKRVQKALRRLNSDDNIDVEDINSKTQVKGSKKNDIEQKSKNERKTIESDISTNTSKALIAADRTSAKFVAQQKDIEQYIPQREKDKACALQKKLYAIEVFRKSKQGLAKVKKVKRTVQKVKKEVKLSESDSN